MTAFSSDSLGRRRPTRATADAPSGSSGAYGSTIRCVLRFVRFVLLSVMTLLVLGLVVAVGTPETGPLEKAVAALAIVGAVVVAGPVRRIGSAA
jgi:hypothetical protein